MSFFFPKIFDLKKRSLKAGTKLILIFNINYSKKYFNKNKYICFFFVFYLQKKVVLSCNYVEVVKIKVYGKVNLRKTFAICKLSVLEICVIKPIYNNTIKVMNVILTIFTMSYKVLL